MKKITSLFLSVLMAVSLIAIAPLSSSAVTSDDDYYYGWFDFTDESIVKSGEWLSAKLNLNDNSIRLSTWKDAVLWQDTTDGKKSEYVVDLKAEAKHTYKVKYEIVAKGNQRFSKIDGVRVNGVECEWYTGEDNLLLVVEVPYSYVRLNFCTSQNGNDFFIPKETVTLTNQRAENLPNKHIKWLYDDYGYHREFSKQIFSDTTQEKATFTINGTSDTEMISVIMDNHTTVIEEGIPATCLTDGKTARTTCSVCNAVISESEVIPATGHKEVNNVTKASLSKDGKITVTCANEDNKVLSSSVINRVKSISLNKNSFTYNGKTQKPNVVVKDSKGKTLKNNKDYSLTYSKGCKNVGSYTVKVTLKGNYTGTKSLKFNIVPKGTAITKVTPAKKSFKANFKKQTTQTNGYELQYSLNKNFSNSKIATVKSNKLTSVTVKNLKSKKKYFVRIRTYKTVNGKKITSSYSSAKQVTVK